MGFLAIAEGTPFIARGYFEEALIHYPDHSRSIVGLSNILLDIYSEVLLPPPTVPGIDLSESNVVNPRTTALNVNGVQAKHQTIKDRLVIPSTPLGLGNEGFATSLSPSSPNKSPIQPMLPRTDDELPAPYKAASLPLVDRLAARDRAYGLLSGLTKLGSGWNDSDAWFALARAYEESGQPDRAKEALWWCVELEEGMGARDWKCVGAGGYVL